MPPENPFARSSKIKGRNAYRKSPRFSSLVLCAVLASVGISFSLPAISGGFSPVSIAKASGTSEPMLDDANIDLLAAPVSAYVDATIPTQEIIADGSALVSGVDFDGTTTPAQASTVGDTEVDPTSTSGTISTYVVKPGDTLSQIAATYGVSMNTILWANDITDQSKIKPGMTLVILPVSGIQHTVRAGETLSSIAEKYGANAADIAQFNGISSESSLQAGSTIIIPGGELSSDDSSHTTSSTSSGTKKKSTSGKTSSVSESSKDESSGSSSGVECDNTSGNPCHGINGPSLHGFFTNPLPAGAMVSQGLHGWDAVDLAIAPGTPIYAAADGTVILSRDDGSWNGGYGNYVILDNGSGVETLYAHMTQTKAEVGESVSAGDIIGYVGMTGDATGPHLHFEVRGARNPFAFCMEGMQSDDCFNP